MQQLHVPMPDMHCTVQINSQLEPFVLFADVLGKAKARGRSAIKSSTKKKTQKRKRSAVTLLPQPAEPAVATPIAPVIPMPQAAKRSTVNRVTAPVPPLSSIHTTAAAAVPDEQKPPYTLVAVPGLLPSPSRPAVCSSTQQQHPHAALLREAAAPPQVTAEAVAEPDPLDGLVPKPGPANWDKLDLEDQLVTAVKVDADVDMPDVGSRDAKPAHSSPELAVPALADQEVQDSSEAQHVQRQEHHQPARRQEHHQPAGRLPQTATQNDSTEAAPPDVHAGPSTVTETQLQATQPPAQDAQLPQDMLTDDSARWLPVQTWTDDEASRPAVSAGHSQAQGVQPAAASEADGMLTDTEPTVFDQQELQSSGILPGNAQPQSVTPASPTGNQEVHDSPRPQPEQACLTIVDKPAVNGQAQPQHLLPADTEAMQRSTQQLVDSSPVAAAGVQHSMLSVSAHGTEHSSIPAAGDGMSQARLRMAADVPATASAPAEPGRSLTTEEPATAGVTAQSDSYLSVKLHDIEPMCAVSDALPWAQTDEAGCHQDPRGKLSITCKAQQMPQDGGRTSPQQGHVVIADQLAFAGLVTYADSDSE